MYIPHFVYPFIRGWAFGLLPPLTIVLMLQWTLVYKYLFESMLLIPRIGIAGSYGYHISNFLSNHHIVFHSGYTVLHSYQQCTKVTTSSHSHQHLLFLIVVILMGMKWHLFVVLHFPNGWASFAYWLFSYLLWRVCELLKRFDCLQWGMVWPMNYMTT